MKNILMTAYDVDPYKGSESGLGWNLIYQASRYNHVVAVTRKNNRKNIEQYIAENKLESDKLTFQYFDLPYYLRFWKVGARGSTLYFYLWQMFVTIFIINKKITFDIAHNVNFSTDSIPSFLWLLRKPFIWGPINHHEIIKREFIKPYGIKAYVKDRMSWGLKLFFWHIDPFNKLSKHNAYYILGGNQSVKHRLQIASEKFILFPSSGSKFIEYKNSHDTQTFNVLVAGRFVPLKGIDIAINAFKLFIKDNPTIDNANLTVIGRGPYEYVLKQLAKSLPEQSLIQFIQWIEPEKLSEYYRNSSVFIFPSHEGAGMVVVEAMAYGLPVICFDNFGPGEIIDENSGIKIPYSSYDKCVCDFAYALQRLYNDKILLTHLSQGARNRYENNYTWDIKGELLNNVYDKIS